ncbi:MAG: DUF1080 domain-containing protein [Acidobacteriota bacterium]|nr:MAG: DUF1080 domain-containing protein [Acidobacteriota bacterium]
MKYRMLICLALFVTGGLLAQNDPDKEEWIQLFNGKDLTGWSVKLAGHELNDNYANTFRVEDGVMKVLYDGYSDYENRFGHIFYKDPFSYYRVRVEHRFLGEQVPGGPDWAFRNSGIMVHCLDPKTMTKEQDFPISIEVQLLGGRETGERSTGNLCTPGTNVEIDGKLFTQHCLNSSSKTYRGDQWVTAEAVVLGGESVKHIINGETVLEYQKPQIGGGSVSGHNPAVKEDGKLLTEGYISLQSESHPIEFRKVELLKLIGCTDKKAKNYKSYYVKSDNSTCEY